jgi:hypothetical protein
MVRKGRTAVRGRDRRDAQHAKLALGEMGREVTAVESAL